MLNAWASTFGASWVKDSFTGTLTPGSTLSAPEGFTLTTVH
ncbi:hypothetical protein [Kitasatospora sp. NPDC127060]